MLTRFPLASNAKLFIVLLFSITFFTCSKSQEGGIMDKIDGKSITIYDDDTMEDGLSITLNDTDAAPDQDAQNRLVHGDSLSDTELKQLYSRLEDLDQEETLQTGFALRDASKKPPRTGDTIATAFPPDATLPPPADDNKGPYELLRFAPEGDADLAPKISMTFSQPMVAITGQKDAANIIPANITPNVRGSWRWVGTQTALFEPEAPRFPMATEFNVAIRAGLTSSAGNPITGTSTFAFQTPPVKIQNTYPTGSGNKRDTLILVGFDQEIDSKAMRSFLDIQANNTPVPFVEATRQEIEADNELRARVEKLNDKRWIVLKPVQTLPAAAQVRITLAKGAPSAEGPRTTAKSQSFDFRTYDPLKIESQSCSYSDCAPGQAWFIRFNNRLDEDAFQEDQIRISPEIPGLRVSAEGSMIRIQGQTAPRTTYTVVVDEALQDTWTQKLGHNQKVTFKVGSAPQQFGSSAGIMTLLDPALEGQFPFFTTNYDKVRVRMWKVTPNDWQAYLTYITERNRNRYRGYDDKNAATPNPPGQVIMDRTLDLQAEKDVLTETMIDLREGLNEQLHGNVILLIETKLNQDSNTRWNPEILTWIQATSISLHAFQDHNNMIAWASKLQDGAPLANVNIQLAKVSDKTHTTDKNGVASFTLPLQRKAQNNETMIIATHGDDTAFLPESTNAYESNTSWYKSKNAPQLLWHVFDDRGMYKPNEDVHIKGWVRSARVTRDGAITIPANTSITYVVYGPRRNVLTKGNLSPDKTGGFTLTFTLDDDVNLGTAFIELTANGDVNGSTTHAFQIQEFRTPEFEVSVSKTDGPYLIGQDATLSANAQYYAGGGLPDAPVRWTLTTTEARYAPPGHNDYTFGRWNPWWWWGPINGQTSKTNTHNSKTDASGEHHLHVRFDHAKPSLPMSLQANAAIQDVNRQTWQDGMNLLIHPSTLYVGLKTKKNFLEKGKPIDIDTIATDIDGNIVAGQKITFLAERLEWAYKNGQYQQIVSDTATCQLVSANDAKTCTIRPQNQGVWRIRATIEDNAGRANMSELQVWVGNTPEPPDRTAKQEDVRLIPDQESYKAGETATIRILAPFENSEATITVRQAGLVSHERITIAGTGYDFELPITEKDYPNVYVQVDLVGQTARTNARGEPRKDGAKRPTWASGNVSLSVPPTNRELHIDIRPESPALSPGVDTWVDLQVRDAQDNPAQNAQVTLMAVDEAILALTSYTLADPIASFYPNFGQGVTDLDLHEFLLLALMGDDTETADLEDAPMIYEEESVLMDAASAGGGAMMKRSMVASSAPQREKMAAPAPTMAARDTGGQSASTPIAVRSNFNPVATFSPVVTTDAAGKARVNIHLPDNLTRYRLMAVAVHNDDHFGKAESNLTARLPLMVRTSPPRFLNFGDSFELPIVLQNQTDAAMNVKVAVRTANLHQGALRGQRVIVPANDRIEVRFPAEANMAGQAQIQVAAISGELADASTHTIPVWTPATTEAFATYGTIDDNGAVMQQPITPPADAVPQFGGLEVTTSSTALQSLTDALIYLVQYPFDCAEQIASRLLGVAALRPVLTAFESKDLPKEDVLIEAMNKDIRELQKLQRNDGGFYLWSSRDWFRYPYMEVHVTHALWRAKEQGFTVPDDMLQRATQHIQEIDTYIPSFYGLKARNTIRAYSLYVQHTMGSDVSEEAKRISMYTPDKELSFEAMGWLMVAMHQNPSTASRIKEFTRFLNNRIDETAATAQFTTSYGDDAHVLMFSNRRTDAVLLDAWIQTQPQSDVIPKLVRGLQDHRTRGHWLNTQENVFVLLALDNYFRTFEKETPDFVANMWLGDQFAGAHTYKGRSTDYKQISVPMQSVIDMTKSNNDNQTTLTMQKQGKGRLYYRLGMDYALKSLKVEPAEYGFSVVRDYEGVDNPDDVQKLDDGTYKIKLGARVRVRLTMVAPARRYHVALVDKLPAGFEAINPALAISEDTPSDPNAMQQRSFWWWYSRWYEHQNLRDERAEAFSGLVYAGTFEYTYVARATTPGHFVVPPAKAEEMYHPETFGRTGSTRVVIE